MTKCSDCYWAEQCGCLTNTCCSDYTPLVEDDSAEREYLANVRADYDQYEVTNPDIDDVWGVPYKFRNPTQRLRL